MNDLTHVEFIRRFVSMCLAMDSAESSAAPKGELNHTQNSNRLLGVYNSVYYAFFLSFFFSLFAKRIFICRVTISNYSCWVFLEPFGGIFGDSSRSNSFTQK